MDPRNKVFAGVGLAAHKAIVSSCSFCLSTTSSLEHCLLSSCLWTHGCKRSAAGPNIMSTLMAGKRAHLFHLIRKAKTFSEILEDPLYFIA